MSRTISLTKINAASLCDVSYVCSPSSISVFERIKQAGYDRILCLAVQAVSVEGRCKTKKTASQLIEFLGLVILKEEL